MAPPRRTHPGGIPINPSDDMQYTPTPVLTKESSPAIGSRPFVAIISTIVGIISAVTVVVGFTGKYFFVDRSEYNETALRQSEDRGKLQGSLSRIDLTLLQQTTVLERQEKKIDNLSDTVRNLELKLAVARR